MSSLQRPIGFSPQEISAIVNEVVVEQHAENAAFLWHQRDQAVHAPNYSLKDLSDLDERVEANLDGLRVAGEVGWQLCEKGLELKKPGEVFAAAFLVFGIGNDERIQKVLEIGATDPSLERAAISALGWLPFDQVSETVQGLINSEIPECRRIGVGTYAVHRRDPGDNLSLVLNDSHPRVRARALRLVGEIARKDLLPLLKKALEDQDESCRFWAHWAAARLGERNPAILQHLRIDAQNPGPHSELALAMVLRCMAWEEVRQWRDILRDNPTTLRLAIIGAGILGDPALIPELLIHMETKETGRIAGESFSMVTGVDMAYLDLDRDEPQEAKRQEAGKKLDRGGRDLEEENEKELENQGDDDEDLPWPNPALIADWWRNHQQEFEEGTRYICGKKLTYSTLQKVLKKGNQRQRGAAALERAIWKTDEPLFEVRAVGKTQLRILAQ